MCQPHLDVFCTTDEKNNIPVEACASPILTYFVQLFSKKLAQNGEETKTFVMNCANQVTDLLIFRTDVLCKHLLFYSLISSMLF